MSLKTWSQGACAVVLFALLAGCGGGSSSAAAPVATTPAPVIPAAVTGVSTPKAVSVVTAN